MRSFKPRPKQAPKAVVAFVQSSPLRAIPSETSSGLMCCVLLSIDEYDTVDNFYQLIYIVVAACNLQVNSAPSHSP